MFHVGIMDKNMVKVLLKLMQPKIEYQLHQLLIPKFNPPILTLHSET